MGRVMRCKFSWKWVFGAYVYVWMDGVLGYTVFRGYGFGLLACFVEFGIIMGSIFRIIYGCCVW